MIMMMIISFWGKYNSSRQLYLKRVTTKVRRFHLRSLHTTPPFPRIAIIKTIMTL